MVGAVYVLLAMCIVVICKTTGVFNLAVAEFAALGCFLAWVFFAKLPLPLAIIALLVALFLIAVVVERFFMRPMIGQPLFSAVVVTIGLSEILAGIITIAWPGLIYKFAPIMPAGTIRIGELAFSQELLFNFVICLIVFGLLMAFFRYTKQGLAVRATSEDHQLAQSGGIKVTRMILLSWFVAIIAAAAAGAVLGMLRGAHHAAIAGLAIAAFAAALVGGVESLGGVMLGGLLVGVSQVMAAGYLDPYVGGGMAEVVPFIVLLAVLIFRPYGLFGYARIERV